MKALLTAIIAVTMLGVVGQTAAFQIVVEIIHMEAEAAGGSGENIHREAHYPWYWASGNSDECMQLNINGGPGLTQLYPSVEEGVAPQEVETEHYVINRDPGFYVLAGRCHGGTNFTVLADCNVLLGVPRAPPSMLLPYLATKKLPIALTDYEELNSLPQGTGHA